MLSHQKEKFSLPKDVIYLNTSYMSPLLKDVENVGVEALQKKSKPFSISPNDFFEPVTELKKLYATLIDTKEFNRIACIPSVSYGVASVTNNITLNSGDEILVVEDQFPSNIYGWRKLAEKYNATIKTIAKPKSGTHIAQLWNEAILNTITPNTAVVAMCHVHWADGTLFDLKTIREKTRQNNALLIIDGTQSVGALPFSVEEIQPDALICAAYKWLLGPYSFGLAYFGSYFDNGSPIEESWSNRIDSENFAGLTNYKDDYKEDANRYCMGETANFVSVPMATQAIKQLIAWTPNAIQKYCYDISKDALKELETLGFSIEDENYRSHHLIGIKIPDFINIDTLKAKFTQHNIYVSFRGNYMRVSPHLYNVKEDFTSLAHCIKSIIN
jgi:selenocysteine lyase/cysteine desulfurase